MARRAVSPEIAQEAAKKKRDQILGAAAKVFAEKGYHAAGIADIAARLDMGHGTFYRYFSSKLDIFSSLIDQLILQVQEMTATEDPGLTGSVEEYRAQLVRFGHKIHSVFEANRDLVRLLFVEAPGVAPELNDRLTRVYDLFGEYTGIYLRNGVEKGFLRADLDIPVTALAMNAITMESLRQSAAATDRGAHRDRWIAAFTTLVLDGIAAPKPR
jgi:AcrR family transcriptional regulator